MAIKVKTFKISAGGLGTEEVSRFISRNIGRDLTLINSITGTSLNQTTTEITLNYLDKPNVSVQHVSPANGFVASTGSPLETAFIAFSSPINANAITSGNISVDGIQLTGYYSVLTRANNYIMALDLANTIDTGAVHNVIIDQDLKDINNKTQAITSVFGFTESDRAVLQPGYEQSYTSLDHRGTTKLKYARIDASTNPTKKVTELLTSTSDLIAFTTVQKNANTTELFLLIADKTEPKVSSVFPRQGANNPSDEPFGEIILAFDEPINTEQVLSEKGLFGIYQSFGTSADIDPTHITVVNSKAIKFNVATIVSSYGITSPYINLFLRPGLKSASGIALTKGYVFGHVTSNLASASQGPQGEPGLTGATGATGETGDQGLPGEDGTGITWLGEFYTGLPYAINDAVSYINNSYIRIGAPLTGQFPDDIGYWDLIARSGNKGDIGSQGPQGDVGLQGDTGPAGVDGSDGADGNDGTGITWKGNYHPITFYQINDAVSYVPEGNSYISVSGGHQGNTPSSSSIFWDLMASGGRSGDIGPQGDQGPQGDIGPQGDVGPIGPQGDQGLQGETGATGETGEVGDTGDPGLSFNWSGEWESGNTYVERDVIYFTGDGRGYISINSIGNIEKYPDIEVTYWDLMVNSGARGEIGDTGSQGDQGPQGNVGPIGPQGDQGLQGETGATGVTGETGAAGETGVSFVWSGEWKENLLYQKNDAIYYTGDNSSYISTLLSSGHYPPDFPGRWDLMASGGRSGDIGPQGPQGDIGPQGDVGPQGNTGPAGSDGSDGSDGTSFIWSGTWDVGNTYAENDAVYFTGDGRGYISTSGVGNIGQYPDIATTYWDLMVNSGARGEQGEIGPTGPIGPDGADGTGFDYQGLWIDTFDYSINDIVSHVGNSWIASGNPGVGDDPVDFGPWSYFARTFQWQGEFDIGTLNYYPNDVVSYQNSNWILTGGWNIVTPPNDLDNWDLMLSGSYPYSGNPGNGPSWTATQVYGIGEIADSSNTLFVSTNSGNSGNYPIGDASDPYWNFLFSGRQITSGFIELEPGQIITAGRLPSYVTSDAFAPQVSVSDVPTASVGRTDIANIWTGVQRFVNNIVIEDGISQVPYILTPAGAAYSPDFSRSNSQIAYGEGQGSEIIITGALNIETNKEISLRIDGDSSSNLSFSIDGAWNVVGGTVPSIINAGSTLSMNLIATGGTAQSDIEVSIVDSFDLYYKLDGTNDITADLDMQGNNITSVTALTLSSINGTNWNSHLQDYFDHTGNGFNNTHHTEYLLKRSGSFMSGNLDMSGNNLANTPILGFFNGTFQETFNALVTSDGTTVTMSLEQAGGGDLTMQFSDGISTLDCTPADTIVLNTGFDNNPQTNYVYLPQSTKVLTVDNNDWPDTEHIKVSYFLLPSAGFVQSGGAYVNQNWNDHLKGANNQGHLSHLTEKIRRLGSSYLNGVAPNGGSTSYYTIGASSVDFIATSGNVFQLHKQAFDVIDTSAGDKLLVKNWNGASYYQISNIFEITEDSTGTTINNNKYFTLIYWGIANKGGEYNTIAINLPGGFYNLQSDAENDVLGYNDYTIPSEFSIYASAGFLICASTFQMGTTWSHVSTVDLRGKTSDTAGGASINDHGGLGGLLDDDHTQYLLVDGSRQVGGTLDFQGSESILDIANINSINFDTFYASFTGHTGETATAAASVPSAPYPGQMWYNIDDEEAYWWDSTKSKWLGSPQTIQFGKTSWADSTYGNTIDGVTCSATIGQTFRYDVTLVEMGYAQASAAAGGGFYLRRNGSNAAIINHGQLISGSTQNVDCTGGSVLSPFKSSGGTRTNVVLYMTFKRLYS